MKTYQDITLMHQIMCHRFYEISKEDPYSSERDQILEDIKKLEELADKYLDAYLDDDYIFVSK